MLGIRLRDLPFYFYLFIFIVQDRDALWHLQKFLYQIYHTWIHSIQQLRDLLFLSKPSTPELPPQSEKNFLWELNHSIMEAVKSIICYV
jgi:hypothetical protein